jgi:hypothetical protein
MMRVLDVFVFLNKVHRYDKESLVHSCPAFVKEALKANFQALSIIFLGHVEI